MAKKNFEGYVVMYKVSDKTYTTIFPLKKSAKNFLTAIRKDVDECIMSEEPLIVTNNGNVKDWGYGG